MKRFKLHILTHKRVFEQINILYNLTYSVLLEQYRVKHTSEKRIHKKIVDTKYPL